MSGQFVGMMDPVEFGRSVGSLIRELFDPLKKRVEEIERNKVIDADVIDELAGCLERVDALEATGGKRTKSLGALKQDADHVGEPDERIAEAIARYFAAHPISPTRGVATALIDRDGALVLTMTDGSIQKLGRVVGRDGLSVESRELEYVAETHEIIERWSTGGTQKEIRYPAGGIHDGGYWREGMEVRACQAVTHNGTLWLARRTTKAKPCLENKDDWRVAARKGRDGESHPSTEGGKCSNL